jgi:hypothetical protein
MGGQRRLSDCLLVVAICLPTSCFGKPTQEVLLGGVCLLDLLKFHLKFGPLAPADCEIMQVGQQANRPGIVVGLSLRDIYGDLLPDFRFASR